MKVIVIDSKLYKLSKKDFDTFNKSFGVLTNIQGNRFYHVPDDKLSDFLDWVIDNKAPMSLDLVGIYN